ncbi:MAG TPA: hypothetical protein VKU41_30305 [Polyangiaceae bacterium]|nr:hypothetical protein [Polyangiaceae bacterium]
MRRSPQWWLVLTAVAVCGSGLACGSTSSQGNPVSSGVSPTSGSRSGDVGSGSGTSSSAAGSASGSGASTGTAGTGVSSGSGGAGSTSGSATSGQGSSGSASPDGGTASDAGGASEGGSPAMLGPAPTADSAAKQGPYMVKMYTSGVPSAQDYVNPTVYYTTDIPGPFPGVVVIPGFTETQSALNQWGPFLASHGFVVMMVDTASGGTSNTGVMPPARANGLMEGVTTLKAENTRSGSPLAGKLDTSRMVIMGHSMGGGGTLIAANSPGSNGPSLKAAVGLNPWNPGGTYPNDTIPTLVYDGTADTLVPPSQGKPEYDSIPTTTPKAYVEFNGGSHFVALTPLGTAMTDPVVARIGLSWLEVYVMGDMRYAQFIMKDSTMSNFDKKP